MAQLKKREKILVASAGLILMFFVINQFLCSKEKEPKKKVVSQKSEVSTAVKPEQPEVKKSSQERSRRQKKPKAEYQTWGRDPFYEAYRLVSFSAKNDSSDFRLHGIIKKGNEAYVLIGDAILRKGESDGDLSIIDISKDRVVCRKGRRVLTLVLSDEEK